MGATLQLVVGVASPSPRPAVPFPFPIAAATSTSSCSIGKQRCSCCVRLPPRRLQRQARPSRVLVRAVQTDTAGGGEAEAAAAPEEPPSVDFAFVAPRLLPDGTPDVHYRTACGGQKLRDIMLDGFIDLYGPYDKLLLNCSGGGVCGTCIVEVVQGSELLSPKTDVEKELLKRQPKTWRLACQATVGSPDSTGQMVIQQLPEWKIHEWDKS
ncbi:photosynthetic NDH subunit of subcomplex B 3, chloroplastic [Oryza brachyantha]|uniref:2Fe-2S ferredoxin-type domain-containing protein n=1 Tax=Oryza brachyantha TaxID=4533 RepID=J3MKZ0_ORYBR|nr:photosynthetic NDH subunit of subcomplex B 3, chloroplastic [Oryza brachyantha]